MPILINSRSRFFVFVFIAVIIGCIYLPVVNAPFLFDDNSSIVDNPSIRSLDLKNIYHFKPMRVIGYVSFALNYYFSKLNTLSYHLVNICIHSGYILFSFLLTYTLLETPSGKTLGVSLNEKFILSIAVSAILAVHPLSTFAVSYIVQRLTSLTALFYSGTLFCYLKLRLSKGFPKKAMFFSGAAVLLCCALFTKENSFTIFPQIIILELLCFELTPPKKLAFILTFLLSAIGLSVSVYFNFFNLNEIRNMTLAVQEMTRLQYFYTQFSVLCFYLSAFFAPLNLALDYHYPVLNALTDPKVFVPGIFLLSILITALLLTIHKKNRLISFGILFYFIAIAIESSLIPIDDTIFLHRTYLPNLGLALATVIFGYRIVKKWKLKPVFPVAAVLIWLLILGGVTVKTNITFRSPVNVWERVLEVSPGYARAYQALGHHHLFIGNDNSKAREYLTEMLKHYPDDIKSLNNMGVLLDREKKYNEAIQYFNRVMEINPRHGNAYSNLGNTYCNIGRYDLALDILEKGYQVEPDNYTLLVSYGQLLAILAPAPESQYHLALDVLKKAELIDDTNPVIPYAKGLAWFNLKEFGKSENELRRTLELNSNFDGAKPFLDEIHRIKTTQ